MVIYTIDIVINFNILEIACQPFIKKDVVCVRTYLKSNIDVIPNIFEKNIVKIKALEVINRGKALSIKPHPTQFFAMYTRKPLLDALIHMNSFENVLEFFVHEVYKDGSIVIVLMNECE